MLFFSSVDKVKCIFVNIKQCHGKDFEKSSAYQSVYKDLEINSDFHRVELEACAKTKTAQMME